MLLVVTLIGLMMMHYISEIFFDNYTGGLDSKTLKTVSDYIASTIFLIPIILASSTARLMQKWIRDMERFNELDKLTVDMELAALKNQINPHFLFNMLNNVNVLIKKDPDKASIIILKLSDFLRHQLYENNAPTTSLVAEIKFLFNFLNLEKIRRDNFNFSINCETSESNQAGIFIAPNLFTTFVENAIKHSIDLSGNRSFVTINIKTEHNMLFFKCTNSQNVYEKIADKKCSGLGMSNIKRRLMLLYDDNYSLTTENLTDTFNLKLIIPYDLYYSR
jgi:LytS/YehU family sensor histidine kinase